MTIWCIVSRLRRQWSLSAGEQWNCAIAEDAQVKSMIYATTDRDEMQVIIDGWWESALMYALGRSRWIDWQRQAASTNPSRPSCVGDWGEDDQLSVAASYLRDILYNAAHNLVLAQTPKVSVQQVNYNDTTISALDYLWLMEFLEEFEPCWTVK